MTTRTLALVLALSACADTTTSSDGSDGGGAPGNGATGRSAAGSTAAGRDAEGGSSASTDAGSPPVRPPLGEICDLSDGIRFGFTSGGGFVVSTYRFTNPHGNSFLFIGGGCRYYAGVDYSEGLRSGQLSPQQAEDLAKDVAWERIRDFSAYEDVQCPDAGSHNLMAPGARARCICQCAEMGPAGLDAAMLRAAEWTRMLFDAGEPSSGPIDAMAEPRVRASGQELAWSLDRPMASIPNLIQENFGSTAAFATFDAQADLVALRALRSSAHALVPPVANVPVIEDGSAYVLWLRDALPPEVEDSIDALRRSGER